MFASSLSSCPKMIKTSRGYQLKLRPFRDESPMVGPPSCAAQDFYQPRLRKCPFSLATIFWEAAVGGGLDGYVWKVRFGDQQRPYALKVFWDVEAPYSNCYAAQRECQNAALLQMIKTAVHDKATEHDPPVLVTANPKTKEDAIDNLFAFSDEGRRETLPAGSESLPVPRIPHMRECYGWLKIGGQVLLNLDDRTMRPPVLTISKERREILPGKDYTAVVYEYVDEGTNDPAVVQEVLDFLWLAGFCYGLSPAERNWKRGVLVDLADIVHPGGFGWAKEIYRRRTAAWVLS